MMKVMVRHEIKSFKVNRARKFMESDYVCDKFLEGWNSIKLDVWLVR
jgi:hypothetical protein